MATTKTEVREASKDDKELSIKDMGKLDPDYFDTYEDAFKKKLDGPDYWSERQALAILCHLR